MKNKYIKDLGVGKECFLPFIGYKYAKGHSKRKFRKQIRKYGFADVETWNLDSTASIWLYSHIKMMLEEGGKIVDYYAPNYLSKEEDEALAKLGVPEPLRKTDGTIFDFMCSLLEQSFTVDDTEAIKLESTAFHIFAIMLPRAWW